MMLRYGEMNGEQGWYKVDENGCAISPFERVSVLKDERCENAYDSRELTAARATAAVVLGLSLLVIVVLLCTGKLKRREK